MARKAKAKKRVLLSSTVRRDILQRLSERGPSSVADLATDMGRPADALYYHVRLLLKNSLIKKHDTRRSSRRDEIVYALFGNSRSRNQGKIQSKSSQETASLLSTAAREYEIGFGLPGAVTRGEEINVLANRRVAWLTDEEFSKVKKHLSALDEILKGGTKRENTQLFAFTFVLSPLEMRPIRRQHN
ncbi:MAG: hypothetical protein BMS9Abin05_1698 [Rhodothermia bacterium]|nr:MAG: hypothetical protein BMS9Abin05_1698 [Rhodothermia bacterium]